MTNPVDSYGKGAYAVDLDGWADRILEGMKKSWIKGEIHNVLSILFTDAKTLNLVLMFFILMIFPFN
jgi:hypothetical protein